MTKKPNSTRLIITSGKVEKYQEGKAKVEIERNWPELRWDERNLILQLAQKKLDNPRIFRLHFFVKFEREELSSEPKYFAIWGTQYYL
jgi:hypothetical protein